MGKHSIIPSMYHRRLLLLLALVMVGMLGLGAQMARLTVAQGAEHRAEAESRLVTERWTPTVRGRILDRKGRVLAVDRPSFDVEFDYNVITGLWAYEQAAQRARREHRHEWKELSREEREALIEPLTPGYEAALEQMWSAVSEASGIEREEIERRKHEVVETVQRMRASIWQRRLQRESELIKDRETTLELADVARPIAEERQPHTLLRGVDDRAAFALRAMGDAAPGVRVVDASDRHYPHESMDVSLGLGSLPGPIRQDGSVSIRVDGVATHLIGWMRDRVTREDLEARPRVDPATDEIDPGHYQVGDSVGATGVEAAWERRLRGLRGRIVDHLDTGEREETPARPGDDVALTLDVALQARVQAILDPRFGLTKVSVWHDSPASLMGAALTGAAVVLDVETGDILAAASSPSFTRAQLNEAPEAIFEDPLTQAWVNRAIARPYQPGSIVKPIVLVEAVTRGVHRLGDGVVCNGHFLPERQDILRCWIYRDRFGWMTHSQQAGGALLAPEALARSCNIYFYTMGKLLGPKRIEEVYRRYGVGRVFDIGAPGGEPGFLGALTGAAIEPIDAVFMGMGQGPVSWTPLHAADAYATLARRGVQIEPRVAASLERSPEDLGLDQRAIEQALEGLRDGVERDYGTANHLTIDLKREAIFNAPGLRYAAKTGTAQAAPLMIDPAGKHAGVPGVVRDRAEALPEHAWTVALVGPRNGAYTHAIAVVIDFAGSGGKVAGPVANQIVHALVAEGYLPGAEPAS